MDPTTLDTITNSIKSTVDRLAGLAETAVPAYAPAIIVGQAVLDAVPELASVINGWVNGTAPTDDERAAVAQQIHDLVTDPGSV